MIVWVHNGAVGWCEIIFHPLAREVRGHSPPLLAVSRLVGGLVASMLYNNHHFTLIIIIMALMRMHKS